MYMNVYKVYTKCYTGRMKMIRIEDEQYEILEQMAEEKDMSITKCLKQILKKSMPTRTSGYVSVGNIVEPNTETTYSKNVSSGYTQLDIVEQLRRTPGDIIREISTLEAERDDKLKFCQDPETSAKIRQEYMEPINKLWVEYKEVKAQ